MSKVVSRHFDQVSSAYSEHFCLRSTGINFSFRQRLAMSCQLTSGLSGRLLDCAIGTGEITCAILNQGLFTNAVAVDISTEMLAIAQANYKINNSTIPIQFIQSDIFSLKLGDIGGTADLVLCLGLIAHTGRLDDLLETIKRLTTPGSGKIILQTSRAEHWGVAITRSLAGKYFSLKSGYKLSYFTELDIKEACKRVGLNIINSRRHTLGIPFGDRIWASGNYWLEKRLVRWAEIHGSESLYMLSSN